MPLFSASGLYFRLVLQFAGGVRLIPDLGLADSRRRLLSLISCFSGGVFLATCLLGLMPDYLQGVNEAFSNAGITVRITVDAVYIFI